MVLATHALTGAALSRLIVGHPLLLFISAFLSHFLLDAIPHWDYPLRSAVRRADDRGNQDLLIGSAFVFDLVKIVLDLSVGLGLVWWLWSSTNRGLLYLAWWGAAGSVLPDALQFVYFKFPRWPLNRLQAFHQWIHTPVRLKHQSLWGISSQVLLIIVLSGLIIAR